MPSSFAIAIFLLISFLSIPGVTRADGSAARLPLSRSQLDRGIVAQESRFVVSDPYPRFQVEIPPKARLNVAFAVTDEAWEQGLEEIAFSAIFEHEKNRSVLVERTLRKDGGSGWQDVSVPLDELAGKAGQLTLESKVLRGTWSSSNEAFWTPPVVATEAPKEGMNFVLLSIDTLRADRLGCYGNSRDTSPNIDRLAKQGVLFKQAIAASNWTLPSHASMFTGVYPHKHKGVKFRLYTEFDRDLDTLAERLWDAGYATAAYTGGGFVNPQFGFDQGFDRYAVDADEEVRYDTRFSENIGSSIAWMKGQEGRPFFLFLHTYTVHLPYTPPSPYDSLFDPDYSGPFKTEFTLADNMQNKGPFDARTIDHLMALYDGEIRAADEVVAELLTFLRKSGLDQKTCLIVTSDHGEEFQEHGDMFHDHAKLYEELVHVPLIVSCPSLYPEGRVIDDHVSIVDILPTVLDIADLPVPDGVDGLSLEPALRGQALPGREVVLSEVDGSLEKREGSVSAVRTNRHKLIRATWDSSPLVFDLESDPHETRDLYQERPELVVRLEQALKSVDEPSAGVATAQPQGQTGKPEKEWDPALKERLRALGYIE